MNIRAYYLFVFLRPVALSMGGPLRWRAGKIGTVYCVGEPSRFPCCVFHICSFAICLLRGWGTLGELRQELTQKSVLLAFVSSARSSYSVMMCYYCTLVNPHSIQSSSDCSSGTYCRVSTSCSKQTGILTVCVHNETISQRTLVVTPSGDQVPYGASRSTCMYNVH